jgi:hypothetical protein
VTTRRNALEYKYFLDLIREAGLKFVIPESLVTKSGGDKFIAQNKSSLKDYIDNDFKSGCADKTKFDEIQKITNWDPKYIKTTILDILSDIDLPVLIAPNGNYDYKDKSAGNILKDRSSWTALFRQDGDLNFYIGLPVSDAGRNIKQFIADRIKEKLDQKNISYVIDILDSDWENCHGPGISITPKINGAILDKDYDIAKALEKAIVEKDLVIVAGNGKGDRSMLDPESYRRYFPDIEPKDLPLMSVVVSEEKCLRELADNNKDQFVVVEDAYNLKDGIKQAIKKYSTTHSDFELNTD